MDPDTKDHRETIDIYFHAIQPEDVSAVLSGHLEPEFRTHLDTGDTMVLGKGIHLCRDDDYALRQGPIVLKVRAMAAFSVLDF